MEKKLFFCFIVTMLQGCHFDAPIHTKNIVGRFSLSRFEGSDIVTLQYNTSENTSIPLVETCTAVKYDTENKAIYVKEYIHEHYILYHAFQLLDYRSPLKELAYKEKALDEKEYNGLINACKNCIDYSDKNFVNDEKQ